MQNLLKKSSKEIVLTDLNIHQQKELSSIAKKYDSKIEKLNNEIFLLTTYKNEEISKLQNEIFELEVMMSKDEEKIDKHKIQSKIDHKTALIHAKEQKWTQFIARKTSINQHKIADKYEKAREHANQKITDKVNRIVDSINGETTKMEQMDAQEHQKALEKIKQKAQSKKPESVEHYVDAYNNKFNTQYSRQFSWKLKGQFLFENRNKITAYQKSLNFMNSIKLIFIVLIFAIFTGMIEPNFFSANNWKNILFSNADIGCMAIGVTVIILTGGIDLSIGSTMALTTAMVAKLTLAGWGIGVTLLVAIIFCAASGLVAGFFVSILKFPPFIITLILMMLWRGAAQMLLNNTSTGFSNPAMINLLQSEFLGISNLVWIMLALAIFAFIVLKFTVWGRQVYATGNNYKSAQLSGIKVRFILITVYIFAGVCIGIGSFIYSVRIQAASPSAGNAWELDAIACVVLGGTLLTGGKGGILQTLMGWFTLSVLKNALNVIDLSSDIQSMLKGVIIMLAVLSNTEYNVTQKLYRSISKIHNKLVINYFYKPNKE